MKTLFIFLVIANIGAASYFHFFSSAREESVIPLFHPEKIILLPAKE